MKAGARSVCFCVDRVFLCCSCRWQIGRIVFRWKGMVCGHEQARQPTKKVEAQFSAPGQAGGQGFAAMVGPSYVVFNFCRLVPNQLFLSFRIQPSSFHVQQTLDVLCPISLCRFMSNQYVPVRVYPLPFRVQPTLAVSCLPNICRFCTPGRQHSSCVPPVLHSGPGHLQQPRCRR